MEKPITLRINELKTNLVDTINEANLPPFLLEQILIQNNKQHFP